MIPTAVAYRSMGDMTVRHDILRLKGPKLTHKDR
jgi:hypothetical protein